MKKVAIIADTTCDLSLELRKRYQIKTFPLHIHLGDKEYSDGVDISPDDIWNKYVPMGFHHFKIEGRTANIFSLVETYCHYLIKPEYQGETKNICGFSCRGNGCSDCCSGRSRVGYLFLYF